MNILNVLNRLNGCVILQRGTIKHPEAVEFFQRSDYRENVWLSREFVSVISLSKYLM